MSQTEIEKMVSQFRKSIYDISDEEVESILRLCGKKIEIMGKTDEYMKLLLPDELKNYCLRMAVNTIALIKIAGRECSKCVECVS